VFVEISEVVYPSAFNDFTCKNVGQYREADEGERFKMHGHSMTRTRFFAHITYRQLRFSQPVLSTRLSIYIAHLRDDQGRGMKGSKILGASLSVVSLVTCNSSSQSVFSISCAGAN
jgi:hypothetical protein